MLFPIPKLLKSSIQLSAAILLHRGPLHRRLDGRQGPILQNNFAITDDAFYLLQKYVNSERTPRSLFRLFSISFLANLHQNWGLYWYSNSNRQSRRQAR